MNPESPHEMWSQFVWWRWRWRWWCRNVWILSCLLTIFIVCLFWRLLNATWSLFKFSRLSADERHPFQMFQNFAQDVDCKAVCRFFEKDLLKSKNIYFYATHCNWKSTHLYTAISTVMASINTMLGRPIRGTQDWFGWSLDCLQTSQLQKISKLLNI